VDTPGQASLAQALRSLVLLGFGYVRVSDDVYAWIGERPGPGWHVHGWTAVNPVIATGNGVTRRIKLLKRRGLNTEPDASPRTIHDRPADDLGVRFDALIVAAALWCWLDGLRGVHTFETPFHDGPAPRTILRWHRRARENALDTQHAIRAVLVERCEPRPVEQLFPGGVSPPGCLLRHGWRDLGRTSTLCQGLTMLFRGAEKLAPKVWIPTPALLAEARGKVNDPRTTVLF